MAIPAKGTLLQAEFVSNTYTTISERLSISGPDMTVETLESTHLDPTSREYEATIPDYGTVSCDIFFDPSNSTHENLLDLIATPAKIGWKLVFADDNTTTASFDGILTGFSPTVGGFGEYVRASITIKVSSAVTWS